MTAALNMNEIREAAPAVFGYPAKHMSDRYGHVNTGELLPFFQERGFSVVDAQQDKPRLRDFNTVAHLVQLQPNWTLDAPAAKVGDGAPRIILRNSHNGRTKLRLNVGYYRFVCANGLVVGEDMAQMEISHRANVAAMLEQFLTEFNEGASRHLHSIQRWQELEINPRAEQEFARRAAVLRFGKDGDKRYPPGLLLTAHRVEDKGRTLWQVFNRVQENTVSRKLVGLNSEGRPIHSRPLTAITAKTEFNKQLWSLAEEVAQAA